MCGYCLALSAAVLSADSFPYGVGQGALGIECRTDDAATLALVQCLTHQPTSVRCRAERALLRTLEGGCQVPIGVSTTLSPVGVLAIASTVLSLDGGVVVQVGAWAATPTTRVHPLPSPLWSEGSWGCSPLLSHPRSRSFNRVVVGILVVGCTPHI